MLGETAAARAIEYSQGSHPVAIEANVRRANPNTRMIRVNSPVTADDPGD